MIVYLAKNLLNGMCYIGQTIGTLAKRKIAHKSYSIHRAKSYFHRAIKQYGWDNFEWTVLHETDNREELDLIEIQWISRLNTLAPNGYNLESGGNRNKAISDETRRRLSMSHKGYRVSEETKRKISATQKGIPKPKGTGAKISKSLTGKRLPEEHARKSFENHRTLTDDQVRSIRQALLNGQEQAVIASRYGLHQSSISNILRGKTYRFVK